MDNILSRDSVSITYSLMANESPGDKLQKVYKTDHFLPQNERVKEAIVWFDKDLCPVR
jgi:hypothetical protein